VIDDNKKSEFRDISVCRHGARSHPCRYGWNSAGSGGKHHRARSGHADTEDSGFEHRGRHASLHGHGKGEIPQLRRPWPAGTRWCRRPLWKGRLSCMHRVRLCQRHRHKRRLRGTGGIQRYACAALSRGVAIGAAMDHVPNGIAANQHRGILRTGRPA